MRRSGKFRLSKTAMITLVLAVVAVALLAVFAWSQSHPSKTTTVTPQPSASAVPMGGHGPNTTVAAGPGHDTTPSATPTAVSNPSHPASNTLAPPTGQPLLSTHKISLANCTGSTPCIDSTCWSVQGASCNIQATRNGQTVVVSDTKTITSDTSGVDLPWNPTGKLVDGTWSVQAVATLNGNKAVSTAESLELDK
jgi:hypothetical protein